ncbi:hypothetical protein KXD40_009083 [Peronospora effusa]|nr:hypothetical protein KXD40_009083 [Peronospora effusa]
MASKVKVAIVLFLVMLVPTSKATSDDEVMLYFPAVDTPNAASGWSSRYLRSTESLTTTNEGNGEERAAIPESFAKLKGYLDPVTVAKEGDTMPLSKESDALNEGSKKMNVPMEKLKNAYKVYKKWWATAMNSILRKDDEVKHLVQNVNNDDIEPISKILETKHFQRWYNMQRSAEDIHDLLGLPKGPALLESPLVWVWLDYTIWVGRNKKPEETIELLEKMFGSNVVVAKMFQDVSGVSTFEMKNHAAMLSDQFLNYWLKPEHDLGQLRTKLTHAGFTKERIAYYEKIYNQYHPAPKAPEGPKAPESSEVSGPVRV